MVSNQQDLLNAAIDNCSGFNDCQYLDGNKPVCVIAHLHVLSGGEANDMAGCVSQIDKSAPEDVAGVLDLYKPETLTSYPRQLLVDLQSIWDSGQEYNEDHTVPEKSYGKITAKRRMKEIVTEYYKGIENEQTAN